MMLKIYQADIKSRSKSTSKSCAFPYSYFPISPDLFCYSQQVLFLFAIVACDVMHLLHYVICKSKCIDLKSGKSCTQHK